jgi:hypothetical protein
VSVTSVNYQLGEGSATVLQYEQDTVLIVIKGKTKSMQMLPAGTTDVSLLPNVKKRSAPPSMRYFARGKTAGA